MDKQVIKNALQEAIDKRTEEIRSLQAELQKIADQEIEQRIYFEQRLAERT